MDTKDELYLEYARCINMCKGTEVKPWECVRLIDVPSKFDRHPRFESSSDCYKFAIFILEDKPVFPGDKLYLKNSANNRCDIYEDGDRIKNYALTGIFIGEDWKRYVPGVECRWSWNPPKKQECIINTPFAWGVRQPKSSFVLNSVKLPSPTSASLPAKQAISIKSGRLAHDFEFESEAEADLVALAIMKILMTAFEERSKP